MFVSKTTKIKTPIQASLTLTPMPIPMSTFYPYPFSFYNYNSSPKFSSPYPPSVSNHNNSQITNISIPTIQKFLEDLDEEFGVGKFTNYSDNFVDESIDVLDILDLEEKDFDKLGITNIGIRTKL
ncbi:6096_t:CDS:1, partial [Funneliformis geosporum]